MVNDREMLELAAKAAGVGGGWEFVRGRNTPTCYRGADGRIWNPRDDDGDSFRLMVKLNLHIGIDAESAGAITVEWGFDAGGFPGKGVQEEAPIDGDDCAATRLAIFRAAVEIGRAMK